MSSDPAMGEYIPLSPKHQNAEEYHQNLPGAGGVFNSRNLQTYHYAGNNPIRYTDPTGEWYIRLGITGSAGAGFGVTGGFGVAIGYTKEKGVQFGSYTTSGAGTYTGVGASIGTEVGVGTGNISDMDGAGVSVGGSGGIIGVDASTSMDGQQKEISFSAGVSVGTPEKHTNVTHTTTTSVTGSEIISNTSSALKQTDNSLRNGSMFNIPSYLVPTI